jgi:alanine racemase
MQSVVRLELGVMQVKVVEAGESVGYGASYVAEGKTRLAIVSGGYADGLHRVLSNVGYAYCSGQKVPIVGRVSMDTMAFDVTHVVNSDLSVIDILGKDQTIDDLAHAAGTIGYEILTSLGSRFQRDYVYLDEGVVT